MAKVKVQEAAKFMADKAEGLAGGLQTTKDLLAETISRLNRLEDKRIREEERLAERLHAEEMERRQREASEQMTAYIMPDEDTPEPTGDAAPAVRETKGGDGAAPAGGDTAERADTGAQKSSDAIGGNAVSDASAHAVEPAPKAPQGDSAAPKAETAGGSATPEKETAAVAVSAQAQTEQESAKQEPAAQAAAAQPTAAQTSEVQATAKQETAAQEIASQDSPQQPQAAQSVEGGASPEQSSAQQGARPAQGQRPQRPPMPQRPAGMATGLGGTGPRPAGSPPPQRPAGMATGLGGTGPRPAGSPPPQRQFTPGQGQGQGQRPFTPGARPPMGGGGQGGQRPFGQGPRPGGMGGGAPRPGSAPGGRPGFGRNKGPEMTPSQEKERVSNYDPNKSAYQRVYDSDKKNAKSKKGVMMENFAAAGGLDDEFRNRKRRPSKKQQMQRPEPVVIDKAFMTAETITVKDLTERIGKPAGEIIKKLLLLGIIATINQELDFDTALLVSQEFGVELQLKLDKTFEETLAEEGVEDKDEDLVARAPVVTIMGHVDHGKTSLLDAIRSANVVEGEAGGITQHIGAYTVDVKGRAITFLDTPGHEAFTSMRMRGAQVTDIAILVVAADDGIMPQTIEAINHAKAADVPIIVAVNKMDRPTANPERIKQELTQHGLVAEEWGGETVIAEVSAVTKQGIDQLLEMILLVADVRELRANPDRKARGVIIEAQLDKGRGPVATVLVQSGTLRVGDTIVAGMAYGRVRAMVDDKGKRITEAGPSMPVEVIGFSEVPEAGDTIDVAEASALSRQVAEERRDKLRALQQVKAAQSVTLEDLFSQISTGQVKDLNLIVKADVQGSVEAVRQSMERLSNEEIKVNVIHGGVGAISISDVMLATTSNAIIIGFNVRPDTGARDMAEREKIDVRLYRVIYNAIEDIEAAMKGMLSPIFKETILGRAQVRQVFRVTGVGTIAGCYVTDGVVRRNAEVRLLRDNTVIYEGKLDSLKRFKDDAREVAQGFECGIGLERYNDIQNEDVIECFINEQIER